MNNILFVWIFMISNLTLQASYQPLVQTPTTTTTYKEILAVYNTNIINLFNALTPQERIMIYYLFRASLPGNIIATDQLHRDALKIKDIFEYIITHQARLVENKKLPFNTAQFLHEVRIYAVYMWTNHSQYFMREHSNEKRTPSSLGLSVLTKDNLIAALEVVSYPDANETVNLIASSLFDQMIESTLCVPDNIEKSAVNFYAPEFTNDDFERMESHKQTMLNAYFYIDKDEKIPLCQQYKIGGKYDQELKVAVYWLQKAHHHAQQYPQQFDNYFAKSLEYLIEYFVTGDEQFFKKHSIEWLQSSNKIGYVYGFIETYDDPKSYRAIFQSDVTIKSIDIDTLNKILPELEERLPFPDQFKRRAIAGAPISMPNASINVKAFSAGSLGPLNLTLAYCLPNYEEIRSEYGSKQVIYHAEKSIGEWISPQQYNRLFNRSDYYQWFQKYDPDYQLMRDIFMLEVILHETLGHGSGQLAKHTFVEGDPLTIGGKHYKIGDTIRVTSDNLPQLLGGYDQTLEELRAEIIALLSSILFYDEFARLGMLKDWPAKVTKEKIMEYSVVSMVRTALRRLVTQADNATEIAGAHAQANMTIMNYLIEHGAICLVQEPVTTADGFHVILDVRVLSLEKTIEVITELANTVQRIKSTGNGIEARWLIDTYGKLLNKEHMAIMKANMKAVMGDLKVVATLYPQYKPVFNEKRDIIDINAFWPASIEEQYIAFKNIALQMN